MQVLHFFILQIAFAASHQTIVAEVAKTQELMQELTQIESSVCLFKASDEIPEKNPPCTDPHVA